MRAVLLIDFGSTHTKVLAIDLDAERVVGRSQAVTTVESDITVGLNRALDTLFSSRALDESDVVEKYASSSAAGGLRLGTIGLVPALTLEAARRAALGAGAKVVWSSGYEIDEDKLAELQAAACDIVLLSGGTDGGDKTVITHNARMLAASPLDVPIVVAGNRSAAQQVGRILEAAGKSVVVTSNVLPELDTLNVEPTQDAVRDIFMKRITQAKGLARAQAYVGDIVMPTPKATLQAARLLADGAGDEAGIGPLLVVEVGGATINIHSVADGTPSDASTLVRGLPETRVKRTVEGDLGIRYNAPTLLDFIGVDRCVARLRALLPRAEPDADAVTARIDALSRNVGFAPQDDLDHAIDRVLAESAIAFAVGRHAGTLKHEHTLAGEVKVQKGKDLTRTAHVVGTGGIFKYGRCARQLLDAALFDAAQPWSLRPAAPQAWIDAEYLMYGIGLLAEAHPAAALRVIKRSLVPLASSKQRCSGGSGMDTA
ncbi:MAG: glutamate mutase L [Burkholderiaceae bacterium]|nr:glutamate mutase L [Burkholderiaceae bacterium]